ncbi:hypothetical protein GUJ93_ZPchr0005g15779 [Zizania palustris]|uniref:Uncharacterized protein n=1 Tax=Zizania palustris TaxID=103762 RepID=A0A8J5SHQ5_ZIZPA|nr:hypothetical protein GUJ93_ZPchr0005g15779 [Zizania palustris]
MNSISIELVNAIQCFMLDISYLIPCSLDLVSFTGLASLYHYMFQVLVVAGLGMLPILPKHLADRACKLSLLGTIFSSAYSLYITYGKPRAWNMPAVQGWLQSVVGTKDFIHLMFSLMLFTSQLHLKIAALPVFCWALDHVSRFLRRNFTHSSFYRRYLEEPNLWVETNNTTLSLLSSNAEIALGFLLIISLFSYVASTFLRILKILLSGKSHLMSCTFVSCSCRWQRSIIQTFMYWHVSCPIYICPSLFCTIAS